MIFKTIKDLQGKTTLGTNFGNIKDFFTRKNILSSSDIDAIKAYNAEIHACTGSQTAFMRTMMGASDKAKDMVANANGNTVALGNLTRASKAATLGLKALSIAGNMLVMWGISEVISGIATVIDNYANRVKYAQERLDEFNSTVSESKNELETQKKWIDEHGERYEELSRGVDNYGHAVSLTSDEMSEYNSLTKDIESMFPSMISGYNDQNQAIVKMKGSVDELTESYKANVEAAYASTLAKSSEGFGDYKTGTLLAQNQKKQITEIISGKEKLKNVIAIDSTFVNDGENGLQKDTNGFITGIDTDILDEETIKQLQEETKDAEKSFDQLSVSLQQKIRAALTTANATIKTETAKIKPLLEAFVYGNSGKDSGYDALDEEGKQVIRNVISRLDDTFYEQFNSDSDMASYFYTNFIDPLKNGLDDTDLAVKINTLFSLNQNDYKNYQDYVNAVNDIINQIKNLEGQDGNPLYSEEQINGLKNALGIGKVNNSGQLSGQSLIDTVKGKYSSIDGAEEYIRTLNEKELRVLYDLKPDESKSLDNLKQAITSLNKEASDSSNETTISTPITFKEAWNSIGTSGDEKADKKAKEAKDKLLELAEAGKLTVKAFENSSIAENFLKQTGLSADEATEKINKLKSSADQLASMKTGISSISSILGEKKENQSSKKTRTKGIGADTLAGMPEDVKSQTKEYEHFVEVLGDGASSMEDCKNAANKLATAYVTSNNFLANLTEGNKDYYTSVLKEMGVENAAEVVTAALNKQKINAKIATFDLKTATEQEISTLGTYIKSLDDSSKALAYYTLQQQIANNNALDTSDSISNLKDLAEQCGITGEAIEILNSLITNMQLLESGQISSEGFEVDAKHAGEAKNNLEYEIAGAKKRLNQIIKKGVKIGTSPKITPQNPSGSKSKKDKKDKKSTQQIDWISRALDRLSTRLDLVKAKYDNLFNNKKAKTSNSLLKLQNKNLKDQYKILSKTEKYQDRAAKKYSQKAKKVKISKNKKEDESLKKAVRVGRINSKDMSKLIATYGEKKANKIQKYQDWYDKSKEAKKNKISTQQAKRENRIQRYQNLADNADSKRELAQARKENATTAKRKNEIIDREKDHLKTSYDYQIEIAKLEKDSLKVKQLQAEKEKELRDLDIEKHQNLADEYQGELDNYSAQKENLKTAAEKNVVIESEKATTQALYAEKIKIAQLEGNTAEALQLQAELTKTLLDLEVEQHQNLADEYQMSLDRYSAAKALATTAADMNSYIDAEKQTTESLYNEKIAIAQLNGDNVEAAKLQYELQKQLRDLEVEKHQNLANEYQSLIELSQAEQDRAKTANDKNSLINNEAEQTKRLYDEKLSIAQLEGNTVEYQKLQFELQGKLLELEKKKFDNISQYYDNINADTKNTLSDLDNQISQMESRGITTSTGLYKSKFEAESKLRDMLESERTELENQHKSMEVGTQEWYEQKNAIQNIENEISQCTQNMAGYLSSIREAKNELRELYKTIENINNGAVENASSYLSRYELTDDDIGGLTEKGIAQLGIYRSQIENAKANQFIDTERLSELAKILNGYNNAWDDAGQIQYLEQFNFGSIEDVIKEYNEYYEKVQSDISERISGEENIISLMKERYNAELAFVKKLIDARKALLSEEKDLYDFQRNVREKVENISLLEKQIAALSSDGSEEAKMKRQQLQSQLDDAKEDLMDVEYDRYISDQSNILDDLYEKYESAIEDQLQDVDALLADGNDIARDNGEKLQSILNNFVDKYKDPTTDTREIVKKMEDGSPLSSNIKSTKVNTDDIKEMLLNEQADNEAAQAVMSLINAIGEIGYNPESQNSIYNARTAYDSLTSQQKAIVDANGGLNILKQKETDYNDSVALYNKQTAELQVQPEATVLQAQPEAAAQEEQRKANAKDSFEQMIKDTYWQDARLHGGDLQWGTTKLGDGNYGAVQKKIHDMGLGRSDKPYVNAEWIKEACRRLGYARPESQTAGTLLNYMNSIGYSSGGVVDKLMKVPGQNGDDGWGTLKLGEYVLKPIDSSIFQDFVGKMQPFNTMMDNIMKDTTKNIPVSNIANTLTPVEIGDINITLDGANVVDKDSLIRTMQTDRRTQQVMKEVVWDKIAGRGSLNVRRL